MNSNNSLSKTTKLNILSILYNFFNEFIKDFEHTCYPGCNTCCTVDVVCTTLEVSFLLERVKIPKDIIPTKYYQPNISINESAYLYLNGQIPPPEKSQRALERCPLLNKEGLCSIYSHRPFACRAMMSRTKCRKGQEADIHPFLVYVSFVFMQIIEHLDQGGYSANLWDIIKNDSKHFVKNRSFPGLLVPLEYKVRIKSMIRRILSLEFENKKLSYYLDISV